MKFLLAALSLAIATAVDTTLVVGMPPTPVTLAEIKTSSTAATIFIFGDRSETNVAKTILQNLGHTVTGGQGSALPASLNANSYDAIFWVGAFQAFTQAEVDNLVAYIISGGGLFVTGERPCCDAMNAKHAEILNAVLLDSLPTIQIGGLGDATGMEFNPDAPEDITSNPNSLTVWNDNGCGKMAGVPTVNVFAKTAADEQGGAAFGCDTIEGNKGHFVILMDQNFIMDTAHTTPIFENIVYFLNNKNCVGSQNEVDDNGNACVGCAGNGGVPTGGASGDPHFDGFNGSKYDFQGVAGEWWSIISDSDFQLNALFVESPADGKTYMGKLGLMIGNNKVSIDTKRVTVETPTLEMELMKGTQRLMGASGESAGFVHVSEDSVAIHGLGFQITVLTVQEMGFTYLNVESSASSQHLSNPHGVLGQTAQFLVTGEEAKSVIVSHNNKYAAGFLEGHTADYMVSDGQFGTSFTFNRFGSQVVKHGQAHRFAHGKAVYIME